ncbi:hypothetical protein EB72_10375 [Mycobacterium sp. SWH-M1]|nr:hypothetical protein EB72_10375 [Mycobacterium sp. SWH-M1]
MGTQLVHLLVGPPVVHLRGIGVQIVELPLVVERVRPVHRPADPGRGELAHPWLCPRRWIVEGADQFPEVPRSVRCGVFVHAQHQAFEIGCGVGRDADTQRSRHRGCQPQHACHAGCSRVAFQDVVTCHQVHRPGAVGVSTVDDRHQVPAGERVHLGECLGESAGGGRDVDSGSREQGGHQVDMGGRRGHGASRRRTASDTGDDERNPSGLVVQVEPLLVQPTVSAQQIAVVSGAHQHGVVGAALGDSAAYPVDRIVDFGVQTVVEIPVVLRIAFVGALDHSAGPVARVVRVPKSDLGGGFRGQVLVGRGCRRHRWGIEVRRA